MLVHLHVKNLALIEETEVDFGRGLNILTGETGAGKSILLGSVQLILGGKCSRNRIRENADYALVELLFQIENPKVEEALRAMDIYPEDGQVLLSRRITEGRSINKINGETSTVGRMKAAAAYLLDIHGQHEHQSLLYPDKQLDILDAYGKEKIHPLKMCVKEAYDAYCGALAALKALDMDEEQRKREEAFLEFEIQEIQDACLQEGEDEELERQYKKLGNARLIAQELQQIRELTGYEQGAGDQVGSALHSLGRISQYDEELLPMQDLLSQIDGFLNDFNRELSSYAEDIVFDDELFFETEQRLNRINSLKAKYGKEISSILHYQAIQQEKLEILYKYEENLQAARSELERTQNALENASSRLSEVRRQYAMELDQKVIEGLKDLNFPDVDFSISFRRRKTYTAGGFDEVEYEIATNPGEKIKPLNQIVSGGELSRIMLALKAILADRDQIETLIFDEIDTGISGRTAQKVSEKMAVIGRQHQVLCITHLPQIAAMADRHFEIEKHVKGTETTTQIHVLDQEASVRELARLLGGAKITDAVLQNAHEMKELAQVHKNTRLK